MWRRLIYRCITSASKNNNVYHRMPCRSLLSEAYACSNEWRDSRQVEMFKNVDPSDLAVQISDKIDKEGRVPAFDMDILAHKMLELDSIQLDFVQTIFSRFRHTNESLRILPSTPYALIRSLLERNEIPRLMEILQDKINYGIFLDYHMANLLMDQFIEKKLYKEAAQVAIDLMLQEELSADLCPDLTRKLAWYACHLHLTHRERVVAATEEATEEREDEDESDDEEEGEVWVRVSFIQNPWFDDHFDLDRDDLLLGKTLTHVATPGGDALSRSYELIGWALYEKFEKALALLRGWVDSDLGEVVSQRAIDELRDSLDAALTRELPDEPKDAGCIRLDDVRPYLTEQQKADLQAEFKRVTASLSADRLSTASPDDALRALVTTAGAACVADDVAAQTAAFGAWGAGRESRLAEETVAVREAALRSSIERRLASLKATEERLVYFEEEERIGLGVERAPKMKPIEDVAIDEQFVAPPSERGKAF